MYLRKEELREIVRRQVPRITHNGDRLDDSVLKQDEETRKSHMTLKEIANKQLKELGY